jgi:hypothetical protein
MSSSLQGFDAALAGADPDDRLDGIDPDLAVADPPVWPP